MRTRYRVIWGRDDETGTWGPLGAVYERAFASGAIHAMPVIGPDEPEVHWRDWQAIDRQIGVYGLFGPPLEDYHLVFRNHAGRYRLSDMVYTIEGDSYPDIRQQLYRRYVLGQTPAPEPQPVVVTYERLPEPARVGISTIHEEPITYTIHEEETQ